LRGQVRRHRDLDMPVVCYQKRWDSVTFYLGHSATVFAPDEREQMYQGFENCAATLVFLKKDKGVREVLEELPATLEFIPRGRQGWNVASGIVRRKSVTSSQ